MRQELEYTGYSLKSGTGYRGGDYYASEFVKQLIENQKKVEIVLFKIVPLYSLAQRIRKWKGQKYDLVFDKKCLLNEINDVAKKFLNEYTHKNFLPILIHERTLDVSNLLKNYDCFDVGNDFKKLEKGYFNTELEWPDSFILKHNQAAMIIGHDGEDVYVVNCKAS